MPSGEREDIPRQRETQAELLVDASSPGHQGDSGRAEQQRLDLQREFGDEKGNIKRWFVCSHGTCAVALTDRHELYLRHPKVADEEDLKFGKLLLECQNIEVETGSVLRGRCRRVCMERIFNVISCILMIIDTKAKLKAQSAEFCGSPSLLILVANANDGSICGLRHRPRRTMGLPARSNRLALTSGCESFQRFLIAQALRHQYQI